MERPEQLVGLGPVFVKVKAKDKAPIEKGWQDKPYEWDDPSFQEHLNADGNYGVIGGNGIVFVDIDDPDMAGLVRSRLPDTFTVRSPGSGGYHFGLRSEGDMAPFRLNDEDGKNIGDVQGKGKMVVGPGCTHPKGGTYEIVNDVPLALVTEAELREALREWLITHEPCERTQDGWETDPFEPDAMLTLVGTEDLTWDGTEYQGKHPLHESTGGKNFRYNPETNEWHCFRHNTGGGPALWLALELGLLRCEECLPGAVRGDVWHRVAEAAWDRNILRAEGLTTMLQRAKAIRGMGHWAYLEVERVLLRYNSGNGRWENARELVKRVCKHLWEGITERQVNEIIYDLTAHAHVREKAFEPDPRFVACGNGVLDLETLDLLPFDPEYRMRSGVTAEWGEPTEAARVGLDNFLNQVTSVPGDVEILKEWLGYCLWRTYPYHKAVLLLGDGRNGKTTYVNLLVAMLGEGNVAGESLQTMSEDRFSLIELKDMMANVVDDMPKDAVRRTDRFKQAVGASPIRGQKKYVQERIFFRSHAKMTFTANRLPKVYDSSSGFFSKFILLAFPNRFVGEDDDTELGDRLTSPEGLRAALWAGAHALRDLRGRGGFDVDTEWEGLRDRWTMLADPMLFWAQGWERSEGADYEYTGDELYEHFAEFCKANNLDENVGCGAFKVKIGGVLPFAEKKIDKGDRNVRWTKIATSNDPVANTGVG